MSSRRKSTAIKAMFQTERIVRRLVVHSVSCGAADSALSCSDNTSPEPYARGRQKGGHVVKRETVSAPHASAERPSAGFKRLATFLSMLTPLIDAQDFLKTCFTLRFIRARAFYGGTKWFC